ncbi:hypothetical protein J5N97_028545 [Dioscorea zingiberensis]|uniref:BHLH domain-containing protein n=1 Tax=Dioscorea zingiberensis TaxID=325984 RepID=A0A9D5H4X4_9LILI|nr:hypothetical protein J5N97_028545 [Dioscorea zingiberensis]
MAQLLGSTCSNANEFTGHDLSFAMPSVFWSNGNVPDSFHFSDDPWPQGSGAFDAGFSVPLPVVSSVDAMECFFTEEEQMMNITPSLLHVVPSQSSLGDDLGDSGINFSDPVVPQLKRKYDAVECENPAEIKKDDDVSTASPKKKTRASSVTRSPKKARKTCRAKDEDDSNAAPNGQSSSCYSSEDDSNASQELNGGSGTSSSSKGAEALNLSGKTRASRGSATDPQSLYARKRRERINERLRILQNLVPNGTKVDISTMLEEAVQYVKFLQLQIKLLSSDDLWMYAPIAYNGMDIGLMLPQKL